VRWPPISKRLPRARKRLLVCSDRLNSADHVGRVYPAVLTASAAQDERVTIDSVQAAKTGSRKRLWDPSPFVGGPIKLEQTVVFRVVISEARIDPVIAVIAILVMSWVDFGSSAAGGFTRNLSI